MSNKQEWEEVGSKGLWLTLTGRDASETCKCAPEEVQKDWKISSTNQKVVLLPYIFPSKEISRWKILTISGTATDRLFSFCRTTFRRQSKQFSSKRKANFCLNSDLIDHLPNLNKSSKFVIWNGTLIGRIHLAQELSVFPYTGSWDRYRRECGTQQSFLQG